MGTYGKIKTLLPMCFSKKDCVVKVMWHMVRGGLVSFTTTGVILLTVLTIASFFGQPVFHPVTWLCDLISHFRLQLLVSSAICFLTLLLLVEQAKLKRFALLLSVAFITVLLNAWLVAPYYVPKVLPAIQPKTRIRLLHLNVYMHNHNVQPTQQLIATQQADIINLQEYNTQWRNNLEATGVLKVYPYRFYVDGGDDAIYSKFPFKTVRAEHIGNSPHGADVGIVATVLPTPTTPITFLFSHTTNPQDAAGSIRQQAHFDFWQTRRASYGSPFVLVGDINTAPWSYGFRILVKRMNLRDRQLGFVVQPSFPTFSWAIIPIDHCLVSPEVVVLDRKLAPSVGSDHFPVMVELALKP